MVSVVDCIHEEFVASNFPFISTKGSVVLSTTFMYKNGSSFVTLTYTWQYVLGRTKELVLGVIFT